MTTNDTTQQRDGDGSTARASTWDCQFCDAQNMAPKQAREHIVKTHASTVAAQHWGGHLKRHGGRA